MTPETMSRQAARTSQAAAPDPRRPAFSLVLCTLGRRETLPRFFDSMTRQSCEDFEVVLVDQNDPGFLDDIVDSYRDRLAIVHVRTPPGLSRARNAGLARARGRFVAFPDDDCWYAPNTLARARELLLRSQSGPAVVAGRTVDAGGASSVSRFLDRPARVTRANYLTCGNSNGMFFRSEVFEEIGRFDTRLGVGAETGLHSGEETDLLLRVIGAGFVAEFWPDLRIHHEQVDTTIGATQIDRARRYGRGFGALMRKHRFSPFEVAYRLARPLLAAAFHFLRGRIPLARYKWTWARGIFQGYRAFTRLPPRRMPPPAEGRGAFSTE